MNITATKKEKIGIATITFTKDSAVDYNYGNILQNYALTHYLTNNGYDVETIYYCPKYYDDILSQLNAKTTYRIKDIIHDVVRDPKRFIFRKALISKRLRRREEIGSFIKEHINYSKKDYTYDSDLKELDTLYDYFITGSDQVWNPFFEGSNEFYYLTFASAGKRISYAPSIAVENIPEIMRGKMKNWLKKIDFISIREEKGKELLKTLFGIESVLVCDPVFLLSPIEWLEIGEPVCQESEYFVVYILGKKTKQIKEYIKKLEKKYSVKGIDIYNRYDTDSLFVSLGQFISYISKAKFVFTNSFHGAAFSSIFKVPFVLTKRGDMNNMGSRMDNLLDLVGETDRDVNSIIEGSINIAMDYSNGEKLQSLIDSSKRFLLSALRKNST